MQNLVERLKDIWWQIELLASVHPDFVNNVLEMVAPDEDELFAARLTMDSVLANGEDVVATFLGKLCTEMPTGTGLPFRLMAKQWEIVSNLIHSSGSCGQVNISDLRTTAGQTELFKPITFYRFASSPPNSGSDKTNEVIVKLTTNGPYRNFGFTEGVVDRLEALKPRAPNFGTVIDRVVDAVVLARWYERPIRITPMLLVGEAGIGKTYFTDQLAKILNVPLKRIAMDNLQTGSTLAGSSYIWSNTETGEVFKALAEGDHISPLVILDEIDKANDTYRHHGSDSLSALHNLLEPGSAKHFRDASFPLAIDASHVLWVATANDISKIPNTIISRCEVFKIRSPSASELDGILKEICRELTAEYPGISFDDQILPALGATTPREQRQLLQRAVARAIRLGNTKVTLAHLKLVTAEERDKANARSFGYQRLTGIEGGAWR